MSAEPALNIRRREAAPRFDSLAGTSTRCPYCHSGVAGDNDQTVCRGCLARHHAECWAAIGACATCRGQRALSELALPADLALLEARAVAREPGWLRRSLGGVFAALAIACLGLAVSAVANALPRFAVEPMETALALAVGLALVAGSGRLCWSSACLRLWPEQLPAQDGSRPQAKGG